MTTRTGFIFSAVAVLAVSLVAMPAAGAASTPDDETVETCLVWTLEWRDPVDHPEWVVGKAVGPAACTLERTVGDVVHVDPPATDRNVDPVCPATMDAIHPHHVDERIDETVDGCTRRTIGEEIPVRACVEETYDDGVRAGVCHDRGLGGAVYAQFGSDGAQAGYQQGIQHCYVHAGPDGAHVGPEGDLQPCAV